MDRVLFMPLSVDQLEWVGELSRRPDVEVVAAVIDDYDELLLKMAHALELPVTSDQSAAAADDLDFIIVEPGTSQQVEFLERIGATAPRLTLAEAVRRWGLNRPTAAPLPDGVEVAPGTPALESMLRDAADHAAGPEALLMDSPEVFLERWAELTQSAACALWIDDAASAGGPMFAAAGADADQLSGADWLMRQAAAGAAQSFVADPSEAQAARSMAAFPLEHLGGAVGFYGTRLPERDARDRLQVLRQASRQLGRRLAVEVRLRRVGRDRDRAQRFCELSVEIAAATERHEVLERLIDAVHDQMPAELVIVRLHDAPEPQVSKRLPEGATLDLEALLVAEAELARAARTALRTRDGEVERAGDKVRRALTVVLRHGTDLLGTVSGIATVPATATPEVESRERLERMALHAAGSLALASRADDVVQGDSNLPLGRAQLEALLRSEVRRSDRFGVPFLLSVIELVPTSETARRALEDGLMTVVTAQLTSRLREVDSLARLSDTTLAVLNPHTDRTGGRAVERAQAVLDGLAGQSPGVSEVQLRGNQILYPGDAPTLEDLLGRLSGGAGALR